MPKTYFIMSRDQSAIKVGKSEDVEKRLASLQTSNPSELILLCVVDNAEAEVHSELARHRIRGEWFDAGPVLTWLVRNTEFPTERFIEIIGEQSDARKPYRADACSFCGCWTLDHTRGIRGTEGGLICSQCLADAVASMLNLLPVDRRKAATQRVR